MEIIDSNYLELSEKVKDYNTIRKEYLELSSDAFYETYMERHDKYLDILKRYGTVIDEIDINIGEIDKRCDMIYKDSGINKICGSYKKLYEKLINLYVYDFNKYNDLVDGYNEYKDGDVEKVSMKYNDYIDYNEDKVYEGIDSSEKDKEKEEE